MMTQAQMQLRDRAEAIEREEVLAQVIRHAAVALGLPTTEVTLHELEKIISSGWVQVTVTLPARRG